LERSLRDYGTAPRYSLVEASWLTGTPRATLRTWFLGWKGAEGRSPQAPVIRADGTGDSLTLSFFNIVEARFLACYRRVGVPMQRVRPALQYAQQRMKIPRPLLTQRFEADGRNLFIEWIEQKDGERRLLNLSEAGQYAWPEVVTEHFREIEFEDDQPARLFLVPSRRLLVAPQVGFGLPVIASRGIRTEVLYERFERGETVDQIVDDFGLENRADVEEAIRWEANVARLAA